MHVYKYSANKADSDMLILIKTYKHLDLFKVSATFRCRSFSLAVEKTLREETNQPVIFYQSSIYLFIVNIHTKSRFFRKK